MREFEDKVIARAGFTFSLIPKLLKSFFQGQSDFPRKDPKTYEEELRAHQEASKRIKEEEARKEREEEERLERRVRRRN